MRPGWVHTQKARGLWLAVFLNTKASTVHVLAKRYETEVTEALARGFRGTVPAGAISAKLLGKRCRNNDHAQTARQLHDGAPTKNISAAPRKRGRGPALECQCDIKPGSFMLNVLCSLFGSVYVEGATPPMTVA